uniref:C2H2-type domain-containing protein n=1 Tax=Anopheles maculatus TaxID=74869 RepID=A0A182SXL7_9DIPT
GNNGGGGCGHTSGPNDVILPSIFVKIPTQINQQYQQENRLRSHHSTSNEIKSEERSEPIKSEIADTRIKLASLNSSDRQPDVIDNYLNDTLDVGVQPETSILLCEYCPFATLSDVRLNEHRRDRHSAGGTASPDKLHCPVCENKFYKKPVLELHLSEDHEMVPSEVEAVCSRQLPATGDVSTQRNETTTNQIQSSTSVAPPPPNKSRIYIKNVQLLKKPDVIAQETRQENVSQGQQLLSTDQEPSAVAHGTLQDTHQLTGLGEDLLQQHDQALDLPHTAQQLQQSGGPGNGNKIFIRNVSLLQNVNFVPSEENILTNGSSKYNAASYMSMDSSPSLLDPMSSGYGMEQSAPTGTTQSRGSRIYIKNVDILRNPLISTLSEPVPNSNAGTLSSTFNESITSRASSCESII